MSEVNDHESTVVNITERKIKKAEQQRDAAVEFTEVGAAEMFADCYATEIRYLSDRGTWMRFDGTHWVIDGSKGKTAQNHATQCAIDLITGFEVEGNTQAAGHQKTMLRKRAIDSIVGLAATYPQLSVRRDQLDADPYVINTPGGIYDLRTAEKISDPDPDAFHTRVTAVAPDFESAAPMWGKFLNDVFQSDTDVIEYVQLLLGHALFGVQLSQRVTIFMGDGENGKSELIGAIMGVLRCDANGYATTASRGLLTSEPREDGAATPELCKLDGPRFAAAAELNSNQKFNENRLKSLCGDQQDARPLYGDSYTFNPSASLFLGTNFEPKVGEGGHGFWRRIVKVPMDYVVPKEGRVNKIGDVMATEEGSQVLAWLMRGAVKYYEQGGFGDMPEAIKEATESYKLSTDSLARFVEDRCVLRQKGTQGASIKVSIFRDTYEAFCKEVGLDPIAPNQIGKRLMKEYPVGYTNKARRNYDGIALAMELE